MFESPRPVPSSTFSGRHRPKAGGGGACITAAAPGPQKRGLEHSGRPGLFLKDEKLRPGGRGRELTLTVSTMCQAYTMTLW